MSAVTSLARSVARALVVQQLNRDQWHATLRGWDVPPGSIEGRSHGVHDFETALVDAMTIAELTGLPVVLEPLGVMPCTLRDLREVMQ